MVTFLPFTLRCAHQYAKAHNTKVVADKIDFLNEQMPVLKQLAEIKAEYVIVGVHDFFQNNFNDENNAWEKFISAFLNIPYSKKVNVEHFCIAGQFTITLDKDVEEEVSLKKIKKLETQFHEEFTYFISLLCKLGKKPIVVSNSNVSRYGLVKGYALQNNKPLAAVEFSDLPSFSKITKKSNGYSFKTLLKEGFVKKFFSLGYQPYSITKNIEQSIKKAKSTVKVFSLNDLFSNQSNLLNTTDKIAEIAKEVDFGIFLQASVFENWLNVEGVHPTAYKNFIQQLQSKKESKVLHLNYNITVTNCTDKHAVYLAHLVFDYSKVN